LLKFITNSCGITNRNWNIIDVVISIQANFEIVNDASLYMNEENSKYEVKRQKVPNYILHENCFEIISKFLLLSRLSN
jgi:hypothetical protein